MVQPLARCLFGRRLLCVARRGPAKRRRLTEPRLATALWVNALLRRVDAAGDFAAVLYRGDKIAGSVALIVHDRGGQSRALSRVTGPAGSLIWQVAASGESVGDWIERQRRYDPDLWVIELDTPDPARFIDETIA